MSELMITATTNSPLFIGGMKPYGHFLECERFIPAGRLRSMLFDYLRPSCKQEEKFIKEHTNCPVRDNCHLYLLLIDEERRVKFGHLYPSSYGLPFVLPATAKSCKTQPGFLNKPKYGEEPHHGVFDTLIIQLVYDELTQRGSYLPFLPHPKCPKCGERVEPYQGFYTHQLEGYLEKSVMTRRSGKVAINRRRRTAEEAMLYSLETMDEGTQFVGRVFLNDTQVDLFKQTLEEAANSFSVGGRQSKGLGRISLKIEDVSSQTPPEGLIETRMEDFNNRLTEIWTNFSSDASQPGKRYFTISLQSGALLKDPMGKPTIRFSGKMLQEEFSVLGFFNLPEPKEVASFTSAGYQSGWSTAWGLPKEVSLVTKAGSVFVFAVPQIEPFIEPLKRLEIEGIGSLKEEGLGRILVCDPFHLKIEPV